MVRETIELAAPERRVELRLVCVDDDDLHEGVLGLVMGLRHFGFQPEVLVAGTDGEAGVRQAEQADLLVVCEGPAFADATPMVLDTIERMEHVGGYVVRVDLSADVQSNVSRVQRLAGLMVVLPRPREDSVSTRRSPRMLDLVPLEGGDVMGAIPARRARRIVHVRGDIQTSTVSLSPPPTPLPVPPRRTKMRADGWRVDWTSAVVIAAVSVLGFAMVSRPSPSASEPTPVSAAMVRLSNGDGGAEFRPTGTVSFTDVDALLRGEPATLPSEPEDSMAAPPPTIAIPDEAPSLAVESTPTLVIDADELLVDAGEMSDQATVLPSDATAMPTLARTNDAPTRRATTRTRGARMTPEDEADAESLHCREVRRATTVARAQAEWDLADRLLRQRECWPAPEVRASLRAEVDAALSRRSSAGRPRTQVADGERRG